jgi:signal transduction histidine kinase
VRSALVSLACLAAALVVAIVAAVLLDVADRDALVRVAEVAVPLGLVWLVATHALTRGGAGGRLRTAYVLGLAGSLGIALASVVALAEMMFVSHRDAALLASTMAFAAVVGTRSAILLAGSAASQVERLRDGLDGFASGALDVRIEPRGPLELQALARSANAMAERLEAAGAERDAADSARRELVASVSHDLRTPLTSLILLAEAVRDGVISDTAEVHEATGRMARHAHALSALVDDLFEIARLDAGDVAWSLSQVGAGELLGEAAEAFRPLAAEKRLRLEVAADDGVSVHANPEKLQRVLHNLVHNAVRHTPYDGSVTLRAEPGADHVLFEVIDTGEGIDPEDAERAFERFWRADAARAGAGAGLGLSICRAIVEAHGGRIWIEPRPAGTSVRFTVPAA